MEKKYIDMREWLELTQPQRDKLHEVFKMNRSGGVHVIDGKIASDGHTFDDLEAISIGSMQEYLGSDEQDFYQLMNMVLARIGYNMETEETKVEGMSEVTGTETPVVAEETPAEATPVADAETTDEQPTA